MDDEIKYDEKKNSGDDLQADDSMKEENAKEQEKEPTSGQNDDTEKEQNGDAEDRQDDDAESTQNDDSDDSQDDELPDDQHSDYKPVNRFDASAVHHLSGMFQNWFLDYASYVILERAVPHIEDGLKPVQRRILHSMKRMDDGRYNKVANIVGHTMQFHPHGDASIGDALVQMAVQMARWSRTAVSRQDGPA